MRYMYNHRPLNKCKEFNQTAYFENSIPTTIPAINTAILNSSQVLTAYWERGISNDILRFLFARVIAIEEYLARDATVI